MYRKEWPVRGHSNGSSDRKLLGRRYVGKDRDGESAAAGVTRKAASIICPFPSTAALGLGRGRIFLSIGKSGLSTRAVVMISAARFTTSGWAAATSWVSAGSV